MSTGVEDIFNQALGVRTDFGRPADKALWGPFGPFLMGFGHVFFDSAVTSLMGAADIPTDAIFKFALAVSTTFLKHISISPLQIENCVL